MDPGDSCRRHLRVSCAVSRPLIVVIAVTLSARVLDCRRPLMQVRGDDACDLRRAFPWRL